MESAIAVDAVAVPSTTPVAPVPVRHFVTRDSCPVCNSSQQRNICRVPYTSPPISDYLKWYYKPVGPGVETHYLSDVDYALDECRDCGLIYQRDIPAPLLMTRLYERWLDPAVVRSLERQERRASHYFWAAHEITRLLTHLDRPPCEVNFLDYGMGWGNWCLLAKGLGCNVYGVELSTTRATTAIENGIQVVTPDQLPDVHFDIINAEQVFEHLADPFVTLQRLTRSLRPDGVVRIGVPHAHDIKSRLALWDWTAPDGAAASLNAVAPLQHINCFSGRSLAVLGAKAGLHEIDIPPCYRDVRNALDIVRVLLRPMYQRLLPRLSAIRRLQSGTLYFRRA